MKRITAFFVIFILIISMALPASASVTVQPRYTYINSVYASLSINESTGVTTCTGRVTAKNTYPVKVAVYLQQDMGTYWKTVKSWSASGTWSISLTENYAVYDGYTYRVTVTGYVYDSNGNIMESATGTHTVAYPSN